MAASIRHSKKVIGVIALGLATALPAAASPVLDAARAEESTRYLPTADKLILPDQKPLFGKLFTDVVNSEDPGEMLQHLDSALAKLDEPTMLRGFIQYSRAEALIELNRHPEAIAAIEEGIRLLPGYSAPLIRAANIYTYANQAGKAADVLLRAIQTDPATVRTMDDYDVFALIRRLAFENDERRMGVLSERLLSIGWLGSSLSSRSTLARQAIENRIAAGDVAGARALIPQLLVPSHSYGLLISNDYRQIWGDIERWAGPRLELQWAIYLREARSRWAASKASDRVRDYAQALISAGHDETVIREIAPIFYGKLDMYEDQDLLFVVSSVAGVLRRRGKWQEADALFKRAEEVWPLASQPNALNIVANRARHELYAGRPQQALSLLDVSIADATRRNINPDAIASMHLYRACALHELGRDSEAAVAVALVSTMENPASMVWLHACMGNEQAARQALLSGLEDESTRETVLWFVQRKSEEDAPSEYLQRIDSMLDRLRADPILLEAVTDHGRVLPFAVRDGAPPELP